MFFYSKCFILFILLLFVLEQVFSFHYFLSEYAVKKENHVKIVRSAEDTA